MAVHHFGDPGGAPLFFFHGWPSDASMAALLDAAARKLHFRVLAPDRPGIGRSDPKLQRTFADWPADVHAIATHYGLEKFAVLGISGGGPYTLAVAHAMPERITAATVVCGAPPLEDPRDDAMLHPIYRLLLWTHRTFPRFLRIAFRTGRPFARILPIAFWRLATFRLPAPDRATLADRRNFAIIFDGMRRSWAACRDGVHEDAVLYTRPWNFTPSQIRTPVEFWHGASDINFPVELVRKFIGSIPDARLHVVPEEGHYSLPIKHAEMIVARLAQQISEPLHVRS